MMVAEPSGTKIVFLDAKNQGYVFNPINDTLVLIRNMPPTWVHSFKFKIAVLWIRIRIQEEKNGLQ